jgi:hypothetical protein
MRISEFAMRFSHGGVSRTPRPFLRPSCCSAVTPSPPYCPVHAALLMHHEPPPWQMRRTRSTRTSTQPNLRRELGRCPRSRWMRPAREDCGCALPLCRSRAQTFGGNGIMGLSIDDVTVLSFRSRDVEDATVKRPSPPAQPPELICVGSDTTAAPMRKAIEVGRVRSHGVA